MKIKLFNKIGDTCFRVGNQINAYLSFSKWFLNFIQENNAEPTDNDFKRWTKDSGIYDYGSDQTNRLNFVKRICMDVYKIIFKDNNGNYYMNINEKKLKYSLLNTLSDAQNNDQSCAAFKELLKFMEKNPEKNDAKKIFLAFAIYETGDDFSKMYDDERILEKAIIEKYPDNVDVNLIYRKNFYSRKPSSYLKEISNRILLNKNNFNISYVEFRELKKTYLNSFDSQESFNTFVHSNSLIEIARTIILNSKKSLLTGDYFDLFNRVMWGLTLSKSNGKNTETYLNENIGIDKNNKFYLKNEQIEPKRFPYSENEINIMLEKIQNGDYSFINTDEHFSSLPRADIAEYLVNLKFCYLLKLTINEAKKFVNTNLDVLFYPTSHATGGKADMLYTNDKINISIETTIHNTCSSVCNHESYPCISHLEECEKPKKSTCLFLIQPLGEHEKIKRWFEIVGKGVLQDYHNRAFEFKTLNFKQLAALTTLN